MSSEQKTDDGFWKELPSWAWIPALVLFLLSFLFPFLLSLKGSCFVFDENSAYVGDTVGGIFGSIVGLMAAYGAFLAFWVQYKANEELRNSRKGDEDRFNRQIAETEISRYLDLIKIAISQFHFENKNNQSINFKEFSRLATDKYSSMQEYLTTEESVVNTKFEKYRGVSYHFVYHGANFSINYLNNKFGENIITPRTFDIIKLQVYTSLFRDGCSTSLEQLINSTKLFLIKYKKVKNLIDVPFSRAVLNSVLGSKGETLIWDYFNLVESDKNYLNIIRDDKLLGLFNDYESLHIR